MVTLVSAGAQKSSPAWLAVTVTSPGWVTVRVAPLTVEPTTPLTENVTGSPELAVPDKRISIGSPESSSIGGAETSIVCAARPIVKTSETVPTQFGSLTEATTSLVPIPEGTSLEPS
ncbi:MAG: hypothetical protein M2R45_02599 [Verrucomicrobia subdivision 3 bacterium]|nr:hypothetical protein [Limisphaerales bacterium]